MLFRPSVNHGTVGWAVMMMMNDTQNNLGKCGLAYLLNGDIVDLSVGKQNYFKQLYIVLIWSDGSLSLRQTIHFLHPFSNAALGLSVFYLTLY